VKEWLVKVKHYRGGESILDSFENKQDAQLKVDALNGQYQTDNHYVERFDPNKLSSWKPTADLTDEELFPKW